MCKVVQVQIKKDGEEIKVENSFGQRWSFKATDSDYIIAAMVGMTLAHHFNSYNSEVSQFTMSLNVEIDKF